RANMADKSRAAESKGVTRRARRSHEGHEGNARRHVRAAQAAAPGLDQLIHERMRLGIVSALAVNETLSFNELKALLATTDGNLSVHARKLEDGGYIACNKYFEGHAAHGLPADRGREARAGKISGRDGRADQGDARVSAVFGLQSADDSRTRHEPGFLRDHDFMMQSGNGSDGNTGLHVALVMDGN